MSSEKSMEWNTATTMEPSREQALQKRAAAGMWGYDGLIVVAARWEAQLAAAQERVGELDEILTKVADAWSEEREHHEERERVLVEAVRWIVPEVDGSPWVWRLVGPTHSQVCSSCEYAKPYHADNCKWLLAHKALRAVGALEEPHGS